MNFTPELSAFQGIIISADNVHQFSRLSAKGGNEDQINYVVNSILSYLKSSGYIINDETPVEIVSQMRKFAFYMVLNADLTVLEQMVELEGIDSVIWTVPTIPKCLMCELLWNLHMEQFIHEIITYTHPDMAIEVAAAFISHFKYFDPLECLSQLRLLSSACYAAICRLNVLNIELTSVTNLSKTSYHNFQNCVKFFTAPPNDYKLNRLGKSQEYKYLGNRLYVMLQLIDQCFTRYTSKLETQFQFTNLYECTYKDGIQKSELPSVNVCDYTNNIVAECLNNCNTFMLDICKDLVMEVSVDVFCSWSEFEENGNSMQLTVGEMAYKVRNKLLTIGFDHQLVAMIELISREPVEMHFIINATDDQAILNHINKDNEDRNKWIKALAYKEHICNNFDLLKVIETNLDVYNNEELHKLYSILTKHITSELENKEFIEKLSMKVFQQCNISTKYTILDEHFNNNNFTNMTETYNFTINMTEIFNKLVVSSDADLSNVLSVFIQNPQQVYTKIFTMATESAQQTEIMLKVMKLLEKYANYYYSNETEPCIIRIIQDVIDNHLDTEVKQNNFVNFICCLKETNIIPGSKLLLLIIMTNIHKSLLTRDSSRINIQVKLMKEAYSLDELLQYRAPMLAMIAQILDVLRWKINTFSPNAPLTIETALNLQKTLFNSYNGTIPENECKWLKSKLINMQPLNMYYYRSLWNPPGRNYLEIVSGMKVESNMNIDDLTSWLSQVVCSCTQDEWYDIWESLTEVDSTLVLESLCDALAMISVAEKLNRAENTWPCILYGYKNFVLVVRYKYFKKPLVDSQVKAAVSSLASLAELTTEDKLEDFGSIIMPLFGYLSENKNEYSLDVAEYLQGSLNSSALWKLVNKMYSNGSA